MQSIEVDIVHTYHIGRVFTLRPSAGKSLCFFFFLPTPNERFDVLDQISKSYRVLAVLIVYLVYRYRVGLDYFLSVSHRSRLPFIGIVSNSVLFIGIVSKSVLFCRYRIVSSSILFDRYRIELDCLQSESYCSILLRHPQRHIAPRKRKIVKKHVPPLWAALTLTPNVVSKNVYVLPVVSSTTTWHGAVCSAVS